MTSIKLDKNCDVVFDENGICEVVNNNDDIAQAIRVELEQNKTQWAINTNFGTPYLNKDNTGIMQIKDNKAKITSEIKKVILKYPVEILRLNFVNEELEIELKINDEVVRI